MIVIVLLIIVIEVMSLGKFYAKLEMVLTRVQFSAVYISRNIDRIEKVKAILSIKNCA